MVWELQLAERGSTLMSSKNESKIALAGRTNPSGVSKIKPWWAHTPNLQNSGEAIHPKQELRPTASLNWNC